MLGVVRSGGCVNAPTPEYLTPKVVREGTHRAQSIESTLKQVLRLAPVMGITRVANVTGLDLAGIPVVMVCRPNSRSVAVSQGKGIDLASARASGLMEAAELYHAETAVLPLCLATYEELRYQHNVIEVDELPRESGSRFQPNLRLLWCEGFDLLSGENVLIPYEMVHTDYTMPFPDGHGCFPTSSNGLASGSRLIEATSHAICELIERDATTLWKLRGEERLKNARLDLHSVDDRICRQIVEKLEYAGFCVFVWDVTTDIGVAAFECVIIPRANGAIWHSMVATGSGCHPAREVALARALTEAAQARLTVISGVRDDFRRDSYDRWLDPDLIAAMRSRIAASVPTRRFQDVPHWDGETIEDDVEWELKCIKKAGVRRVVFVDLTKPEFGLPVVRVIALGLESIFGLCYVPGRRGRLILEKP
jgi:YcaO-like protein with predicted kinase domain